MPARIEGGSPRVAVVASLALPPMSVAPIAMTALEPQVTPDLAATDIANKAAPNESDWAGDDGPRDSADGRMRHPPGCGRRRGRGNSGHNEDKSTTRSH